MKPVALDDIAQLMRAHSRGNSDALLDSWLTHSTLCRFRDWVPSAPSPDALLIDIGCYQPSFGYYEALGWRRLLGVAKEEGEGSATTSYRTDTGTEARIAIADVETGPVPAADGSADAVLMMEVLEHFGLDPMHALAEANRVLKPGGVLTLSTPNAASLTNLRRIAAGLGPFTAIEFSGFSTNRHNRLYDAAELRQLLAAAGFDVEVCESRSYYEHAAGFRRAMADAPWRMRDWWTRRRSGRAIERGDYLFVRGRKQSGVIDRHPGFLYFDAQQWPEWYRRNELPAKAAK